MDKSEIKNVFIKYNGLIYKFNSNCVPRVGEKLSFHTVEKEKISSIVSDISHEIDNEYNQITFIHLD